MQEEIEQKIVQHYAISTTKLSARTVLPGGKSGVSAVPVASTHPKASRASARLLRQNRGVSSVEIQQDRHPWAWNAMPKSIGIDYAIRKDTS